MHSSNSSLPWQFGKLQTCDSVSSKQMNEWTPSWNIVKKKLTSDCAFGSYNLFLITTWQNTSSKSLNWIPSLCWYIRSCVKIESFSCRIWKAWEVTVCCQHCRKDYGLITNVTSCPKRFLGHGRWRCNARGASNSWRSFPYPFILLSQARPRFVNRWQHFISQRNKTQVHGIK